MREGVNVRREWDALGEHDADGVDADVPNLMFSTEGEGHGDDGPVVSNVVAKVLLLLRSILHVVDMAGVSNRLIRTTIVRIKTDDVGFACFRGLDGPCVTGDVALFHDDGGYEAT